MLAVTPKNIPVPSAAGNISLTVSNTGGGTLNYTASAPTDSSWLSINSGGTGANNGTINISYSNNPGGQRVGNIIVTANGVSGSPAVVTVTQAGAPRSGTQSLGIDVSHVRYLNDGKPNAAIDWHQVSQAGKTFVFHKATEGATYTDPEFTSAHIQDARNQNFSVGTYHFALPLDENAHYTGVEGASMEAKHFLDVVAPPPPLLGYAGEGYLPPVLDIEDRPIDQFHPYPNPVCGAPCIVCNDKGVPVGVDLVCQLGKSQLSAWVRAWVKAVEDGAHVKPIIYTGGGYVRKGMEDDLSTYNLWLADPDGSSVSTPPLGMGPWFQWLFKQYSWSGDIGGVTTPVDLELLRWRCNGSEQFLRNVFPFHI